jgi:RHS repeat-associated protein
VIDGRSYQTSYQYNTANQLTQMTYPSGRVIGLGHDNKGRISSVGSFLSSVTYNGIGQLTGTTLGNGVSETYGYDANRMQLTSQVATQSGGPTGGLMNLTYSYQAAAGQMGAGSTAGNAGQLTSVSGTIGGVPESAAYTYDNLGRLVTSNQTSNTVSAQRRFAYDRWGNRTGMWDAVSGGNQIQSIALQQSGGAPTNQIASVTSGSTVNYVYDAAGNVTNDGVHTYQYDSENRIVSVDGGSTGSYAYDNQNRRYKKTIGSTVTHYVWQGSQVLAEHNGSTGAVLVDYVYSGSRMIAKVASGTTQYFLRDRLSVRLSLDSGGNIVGRQGHLPFGEDFGESGTQEKHHFTNYERDGESGTDYAVNRQYSPNVGGFGRPDPYRGSYNIRRPQSLNRYSYVGNNPSNKIDPLGLFCPTECYDPETGECDCDEESTSGDPPSFEAAPFDPFAVILDYLNDSETDLVGGDIWDLISKFWNDLTRCEKWNAAQQPFGALVANEAKDKAVEVEKDLRGGKDGDDDYANAVKHCVWNCIMTIRLDFNAAATFANAHEQDPDNDCNFRTDSSSLMDRHNNEVGRTIGYNLGAEGSERDCIKRCKQSADLEIIKK